MSLLTVVNDVCAAVGVHQTTAVIANAVTDRTMAEMLALANEMADRIAADTREWTMLRKTVTMTGDGVTEAFDLPADYRRMLMTSSVWRSTNTLVPLRFVPDTDEWLQRRAVNYSSPWGEWTIFGGQIHIFPIMAGPVTGPPARPAVTARFSYLDRNCIIPAGGGLAERFSGDGDGSDCPSGCSSSACYAVEALKGSLMRKTWAPIRTP